MEKSNQMRKELRLRYIRFWPEVDKSRNHRSCDLGITFFSFLINPIFTQSRLIKLSILVTDFAKTLSSPIFWQTRYITYLFCVIRHLT